ncbi:TPA: secA translation cis-regulator SecM [Mannheimia haemolytica]
MSLFFKHFHKTPIWSQLLFGMLAILALPEIQAMHPNESEQEAVINQSLLQDAQSVTDLEQQSLFITQLKHKVVEIEPQAVHFCEFFAKSYRLDKQNLYPIRAGPQA